MKKRIMLVVLVVICLLTLSACGCKHENWNEADCFTPKTCMSCGETEGEPAGHSWVEASCAAPKTCTGCGLTEGEVLDHTWAEATTEAPKTCTGCGATEGERIITDERFTTSATADIQGKWVCTLDMTGEMMDLPELDAVLNCELTMELSNDGHINLYMSIANESEFKSQMMTFLVDSLYAELEAGGYNKEAADAAMLQVYGMTVEEYAAFALEALNFNALTSEASLSGVYYVADDQLYVGDDWNSSMDPTGFTLEGDTLTLDADLSGMYVAEMSVFTRVSE